MTSNECYNYICPRDINDCLFALTKKCYKLFFSLTTYNAKCLLLLTRGSQILADGSSLQNELALSMQHNYGKLICLKI